MADLREELATYLRETVGLFGGIEDLRAHEIAAIIARHVEAAVNEEREACAEAVEKAAAEHNAAAYDLLRYGEDDTSELAKATACACGAAAIRERGHGEIVARDAEGGRDEE